MLRKEKTGRRDPLRNGETWQLSQLPETQNVSNNAPFLF